MSKFNQFKSDIKKTWHCINDVIGRKKSKSSPIILRNTDGTPIPNELVPDSFNNYYTSIASDLISNLPSSNNDFKSYLNTPIMNTIFLHPTTTHETINVISSLKNKKAHHSEIPVTIYKTFSHILAVPISILFNNMIEQGVFPDVLKISRVTPVFKKDDPERMNNYRPISNLNNLNKIFEKLLYKRIVSYLDSFNLISSVQFGFRKGFSTEDAVNYLLANVYDSLNNSHYSGACFLDLSKAFDTISHDILIYKLQYYGIRGRFLELLSSYLQNRQQYVSLNGIKSHMKPISHGVPQGSILGPLLFLIYVNDLPSIFKHSKCLLYADDTTVFYDHPDLEVLCNHLSLDMELICDWFTANKLVVNEDKTKFLVFTNINIPIDTSIVINNVQIPVTNFHNFLGVIIDKTLSFTYHIDLVSNKISKTIGILYKIKDFVPINILRIIYMSLIQSYLSYGVSAWGAANSTNLNHLVILQKRAIRLVNNSDYLDHTNPIFYNLNILKLNDFYIIRCLKYIYSAIFLNKYNFIQSFILDQQVSHNYQTRTTDLRLPTINKIKCKQSLIYKSTFFGTNIDIMYLGIEE